MANYKSDWATPKVLLDSCGMSYWGELIKPTKGDFSCLLSLFFDNLSTLVTVCAIFTCECRATH